MTLLLPLLGIVFGMILLLRSADHFVTGAAQLAKILGISPLAIGVVVVGFGTSAPELLVSVIAAWQQRGGLAFGNAYGSNVVNIALILGSAALLAPIYLNPQILRQDLPLTLLGGAISAYLIYDGELSRLDALLLLLTFAAYLYCSLRPQPLADAIVPDSAPTNLRAPLIRTGAGLLVLVGSSYLLVWSAIRLAQYFGLSELIIGLTIVALGTSLPELAATIVAARKHAHDLALGNIIGSCLFNMLFIIGIAGLIQPLPINPEVLSRDFPLMLFLFGLLFLQGVNWRACCPRAAKPLPSTAANADADGAALPPAAPPRWWRGGVINRYEGAMLLLVYLVYTGYLFFTAAPN
jgi:cation:H+ antiporter